MADRLGEVVPRRLDRCLLPWDAGAPGTQGALVAPKPWLSSHGDRWRGAGRRRLRCEGGGSAERESDRPADHRRGHPRPSEQRSPGRSLESEEKVKGFVCSCGPGPTLLSSPCLSAPPAPLVSEGVGVGGSQEGQRVIVGPCEMRSPLSFPLRSSPTRISALGCHQTGQIAQ